MNSEFLTPCVNCGRKDSESPLKLDRSGNFHICCDALGCLRTIKANGFHTYIHKPANVNQRRYAFDLAGERGIDLHAFVKAELELDDVLKVSAKAMSCIIQALFSKQIKANRAA